MEKTSFMEKHKNITKIHQFWGVWEHVVVFLDPKNRSMYVFFLGGGAGFQHVFFTFKSKETWFDNDSPQGNITGWGHHDAKV